MSTIQTGSLVKVQFDGKDFDVVVIDPNGLGAGQPTVGFGFRMMERYAGIANSTLSTWVLDKDGSRCLKLPSGKTFRVLEIPGADGNNYNVVEAADWVELAFDLLENPGKTGASLKGKIIGFLKWFAIKGFYADAYTALKGTYTARDTRATSKWLEARQLGKLARGQYTDLLQAQGCQGPQYASWTDYIYQGLFGMRASEMKKEWETVDGPASIARNHIPKVDGLEAVRYCEDMVVRVFYGDLKEAHDHAIDFTKRKGISALTG